MAEPCYIIAVLPVGGDEQQHRMTAPVVLVGREQGDVVLGDPKCSSRHLELQFDGSRLSFRDLGSTNGVLLNNVRSEAGVLKNNDVLTVGHSKIEILSIIGAVASTTEPMSAVPVKGRTEVMQVVTSSDASAPISVDEAQTLSVASADVAARPKRVNWLLLAGTCAILAGGGFAGARFFAAKNSAAAATAAAAAIPPVETGPVELTVPFVWCSGEGDKKKGGVSQAKIRIAPNPDRKVSVGVQEEFAAGNGGQWRTAVWMAAFNASRIHQKPLSNYEFTVYTGGHVDGPSAGMLTTATMLAILRDKKPRPLTTMTGTVNPDGTAGPVGGIRHKMDGAKEAGLSRFGLPVGTLFEKDEQGQQLDLKEYGKKLGLEVVEIDNIFEAYEFLTGDKIVLGKEAVSADMDVSTETLAKLRGLNSKWKARLAEQEQQISKLISKLYLPAVQSEPMLHSIALKVERANQLEKAGHEGGAYMAYLAAYNTAKGVGIALEMLDTVMMNRFPAAAKHLEQLKERSGSIALMRDRLLENSEPNNLNDQLSTVFFHGLQVDSETALDIAGKLSPPAEEYLKLCSRKRCRPSPQVFQEIMQKVFFTFVYYEMSEMAQVIIEDYQGLLDHGGKQPAISKQRLAELTRVYASASGAVIETFEELLPGMMQQGKEVPKELAKMMMAEKDPNYVLAMRSSQVAQKRLRDESDVEELDIVRLAAGLNGFFRGADLVNSWYSLGVNQQADGSKTVENSAALDSQLGQARHNALESAQLALERSGSIPSLARLAYASADALAQGDPEQQLQALSSYWEAAMWSDLAAASVPAQPAQAAKK